MISEDVFLFLLAMFVGAVFGFLHWARRIPLREGKKAYRAGTLKSGNPYSGWSDARFMWEVGWEKMEKFHEKTK